MTTSPGSVAWLEAELEAAAAHARRRGLDSGQWLAVAAASIVSTLRGQVAAGAMTRDEADAVLEALLNDARAVLDQGAGDVEPRAAADG